MIDNLRDWKQNATRILSTEERSVWHIKALNTHSCIIHRRHYILYATVLFKTFHQPFFSLPLNPCAVLCPFQFFFFLITFPVLKLTAKNLAQVCIFIGILLFHCHFLKKIFFCIRYKKYSLSAPFGQKCPHWNPLKLPFLIPGSVNYKIMQSFFKRLSFWWQGFKILFFTIFYQMVSFFF